MIRKKKRKELAIILSQAPEIVTTRKFEKWCEYYFDESNKKTYGNATQSALKSYETENLSSAGNIGWRNHMKVQMIASTVADLNGFGYMDRIKIAITKALSGDYNAWDKLLVRIGDFQDKPQMLVQNNYDFSGQGDAIRKSRAERGLPPV